MQGERVICTECGASVAPGEYHPMECCLLITAGHDPRAFVARAAEAWGLTSTPRLAHIEAMQRVVEAAVAWDRATGGSDAELGRAEDALHDAVHANLAVLEGVSACKP